MTNTVVQLHPLADDAALALLKAGEAFASAADFGRRCGWNRQKAHRRLKEWADAGLLKIEKKSGKTAILTQCPPVRGQSAAVSAPVDAPSTPPTAPPPCDIPVRSPSAVPSVRHSKVHHKIFGTLLILCGLGIGVLSLYVNATGWSVFAKTASASVTMMGLGLAFDILALILPAAASVSKWRYAMALRVAWVVIAGTVFCTSIGFAYGNIGDSVQGRSASMDQWVALKQRLIQWRRDRSEIPLFARTVDEDVAAATAHRVRECDISKGRCTKATETEIKVRMHRGFTARAVELDAKIADLELKLEDIPNVATADPQIAGTLKVMSWVFMSPSEDAASVIRLLIIAIGLSFFPGPLASAGLALFRA